MNGLYRPSADIMSSYKGALGATKMRNELAFQPERQRMEKERFGWEQEGQERIRQLDPMVKMSSFTNFVQQQAPSIKWQNYPQAREYLTRIAQELDIPNFTLPEPQEIADAAMKQGMMPEQYFEQWKDSSLRTAESRIKEMTAQAKLGTALRPKQGETERLIDLINDIPADDPRRNFYLARLKKLTETRKQTIRVSPDGTVEIIEGTEGPGMTMKTKGALEEKITGGKELLARMESIANEFKPEYQEIGTRLGAAWTGIKAKFGRDISPEDAKTLTDFKKFQRKAIENINLYIKEMTGAQMSEKEASRLRLAQPDPGEKWYKGDDPITFQAKMDDVMVMTRAAIARFEYYRSKGLSDAKIKGMINEDKVVSLESIAAKME